mgnify:CR=1 FL=1
MDENKRIYPRFVFDCLAQCAFLDSFPETFPIVINDIGPEGVGFTCDQSLDLGSSVYLFLDLSDKESVKFIGKVRWCQKEGSRGRFRIGVRVSDMNKDDFERYVRFYYKSLMPGDERQKKILLIVRDKEIAKDFGKELSDFGYGVTCAYDGEEGFAKYIETRPDLIILDIQLPKLKGYAVCRKIRRLQGDQQVTIFMLIAKKSNIDRIVGDDVGVQKYFMKPLRKNFLLQEVNKVLAIPKS